MISRIYPESVAAIAPGALDRPEGVALSHDLAFIAVAEAYAGRVSVFTRNLQPAYVIDGLTHPHDVDFSPDGALLAIADRGRSAVTLHTPGVSKPVRMFCNSGYDGISGVQFLPPHGRTLVTVQHTKVVQGFDAVTEAKVFTLSGTEACLALPDGLVVSNDGKYLAVANHEVGTVTVYDRLGAGFTPAPVKTLSGLSCPHSVAFSSALDLLVTNASGTTIDVYPRVENTWADVPRVVFDVQPVPSDFPMERGAKGIAIRENYLVFCGPAVGVRVHTVEMS